MIRRSFVRAPEPESVIRGDVRSPGDASESAVIVVHGFKGFKDWGFFPHVCERLAEAGHAVVSLNFSHNGIGDEPLEFTELERFAANTLTRELDELRFMVDEVRGGDLLPQAPERVGVLGHSRGGGQTILAAAEHEGIAAIATWAAVSDFDRWSAEVKREWHEHGRITVMNSRTGQEMPLDVGLLEDFEANRDRLDIESAARRITVPWLIVHGLDDETVASAEGRRLADLASDGLLVLVEGAGHTFEARHPFVGATPELERALTATVEHFGRHLPG